MVWVFPLTVIKTLGGRFELPSYYSTGFPDLRPTRLGYPSNIGILFIFIILFRIMAPLNFYQYHP